MSDDSDNAIDEKGDEHRIDTLEEKTPAQIESELEQEEHGERRPVQKQDSVVNADIPLELPYTPREMKHLLEYVRIYYAAPIKEDDDEKQEQQQQHQQATAVAPIQVAPLEVHRKRNQALWQSIQLYHKSRIHVPANVAVQQSVAQPKRDVVCLPPYRIDQQVRTCEMELMDQKWLHWSTMLEYWLHDKWLDDKMCSHYIQAAYKRFGDLEDDDIKHESTNFLIAATMHAIGDRLDKDQAGPYSLDSPYYPQCMLLFCAWAQRMAIEGCDFWPKDFQLYPDSLERWWSIAVFRTWTIMHEKQQQPHPAFIEHAMSFQTQGAGTGAYSGPHITSFLTYWLLRIGTPALVKWWLNYIEVYGTSSVCLAATLYLPVVHITSIWPSVKQAWNHAFTRLTHEVHLPLWMCPHMQEWCEYLTNPVMPSFENVTTSKWQRACFRFSSTDPVWCQTWIPRLLEPLQSTRDRGFEVQWLVNVLPTPHLLAWIKTLQLPQQKWQQAALDQIYEHMIQTSLKMVDLFLAQLVPLRNPAQYFAPRNVFVVRHGAWWETVHAEYAIWAYGHQYKHITNIRLSIAAPLADLAWSLAMQGYLSVALRLIHACRLDTRWQHPPERIVQMLAWEKQHVEEPIRYATSLLPELVRLITKCFMMKHSLQVIDQQLAEYKQKMIAHQEAIAVLQTQRDELARSQPSCMVEECKTPRDHVRRNRRGDYECGFHRFERTTILYGELYKCDHCFNCFHNQNDMCRPCRRKVLLQAKPLQHEQKPKDDVQQQ